MVTAELPAFARTGSRIDVTVCALGDATNLTGGILLVTPLLAADGEVYAVAQGALATGAIAARGAASSVTRGVPTVRAHRQRRHRWSARWRISSTRPPRCGSACAIRT